MQKMPPSPSKSNSGYTLWREHLNGAVHIVAPMVDQSELAWRILARRHGAQLCYTPMLHASIFVKDARYRKENLTTCKEDRPLIVQFCANNPETFLEAVRLVEGHCDAVDLNIGCPQAIARRGHYGAFLQDEWDLLYNMVHLVHTQVSVPITCKVRIFKDIDRTIRYAKMLEDAGCQLLSVHGRTREQKGPLTGVASWEHIKAIKENVNIPVFANGNIQYTCDIKRCLEATKADGVMIAEGHLHNPALFDGQNPLVWDMAIEYLNLVKEFPCPLSFIRGHLFKLFHYCLTLPELKDLQEELAKANTVQGLSDMTLKLKERLMGLNGLDNNYNLETKDIPFQLPLPVYICQPYVRPSESESNGKTNSQSVAGNETSENQKTDDKKKLKRELDIANQNNLSRKKLKKLLRNPKKNFQRKGKEEYKLCAKCFNPKGSKCLYSLCRTCCRVYCHAHLVDCAGHRHVYQIKKQIKDSLVNDSEQTSFSVSQTVKEL